MVRIGIADLKFIFGPKSRGTTVEERARTSTRIFVRSQDQLAEYAPATTGRQFTAWEALQAFGLDVLREVCEYGSAILPATADEPAATLRKRREDLGFEKTELASITGLRDIDIDDAENPNTRTPIRIIEKMAQALALNEHKISFVPSAEGDELLAYRLRDLRSGPQPASPRFVSQLCEVAWVVRKQHELKGWLDPSRHYTRLDEPSPNYGDSKYPAWQHGYYLAGRTRELLKIPADEPIDSLRDMTEALLGIPVIQSAFPNYLAGATVASGDKRGIAVNIVGDNENVWVRRMTLAHELGHLLWDPDEKLQYLQVDEYSDLEEPPWEHKDFVEQRANAFAVEFLAPQQAAVRVFNKAESYSHGLRAVMETFGLSFTSAKYHIWNGLDRNIPIDDLVVDDYHPSADWIGRESFTVDYFKPESVPISRRGKFASLVVQAESVNLITKETASTYLSCTPEEYNNDANFIREIFELEATI